MFVNIYNKVSHCCLSLFRCICYVVLVLVGSLCVYRYGSVLVVFVCCVKVMLFVLLFVLFFVYICMYSVFCVSICCLPCCMYVLLF